MKHSYEITVDNEAFSVSLEGDVVHVNGRSYTIDASFPGEGHLSLLVDGSVSYSYVAGEGSLHPLQYVEHGNPFQINVDGHTHEVIVEDQRSLLLKTVRKSQTEAVGSAVITAPMPGLVAKILVKKGEQVTAGQGVVILEAMKMENEIRASQSGFMKEILVQPGQAVEKGQILARLVSEEAEAA